MAITFPPNPSDGMIFEASPGLFYQWNAASATWIRIDGAEAIVPATPLQDGLMTSEDLRKLMNLIIPPPQATLKGEDCQFIFRRGHIGLYSNDGSLSVEPSLNLQSGNMSVERPWDILRNTVGIDFTLNMDQFISEIQTRGQIIEQEIVGDKGPTGDTGDAGRDQLDTGPTGLAGLDGVNSPFAGSLAEDNLALNTDQFSDQRAIVNVSVERISETENYLVFTRANIGNPDACPSEVVPRKINSPWLIVAQPGVTSSTKRTTLTGDCSIPCAVCSSGIYYLNIDPLLEMIFDRFKELVLDLKKAKEDLVAEWLKAMIFLFNQQKAALCCALENCRSRTRNTQTRQYIETQRIQAALGDFSLVVDGEEDRMTIDLDEYKSCIGDQTQEGDYIKVNLDATCDEWLYELTLDAAVHNRDPRVAGNGSCLMVNLPRGSYFMQVIGCCAAIGAAASRGLVGAEIARDEQGNIIEVANAWIAGGAYEGEPVPGDSSSIYVYDPSGVRRKVSLTDIDDPAYQYFPTRAGYSEDIQYTGRVAMLYEWEREEGSGGDKVVTQQEVVQLPNLGKLSDEAAARSAYQGLTALFTHAGGST